MLSASRPLGHCRFFCGHRHGVDAGDLPPFGIKGLIPQTWYYPDVAILDPEEFSNAERVTYIDLRVEQMKARYLQWAGSAKVLYRTLNFATIVFSAAVPVVVLVAPLMHIDEKSPVVASVAGILGACATLARSIDSLFKNHETWMRNNDSYGRLCGEQFLFQERAGYYRGLPLEDRISLYAERIENIIGSESTSWIGAEKSPQGGA